MIEGEGMISNGVGKPNINLKWPMVLLEFVRDQSVVVFGILNFQFLSCNNIKF